MKIVACSLFENKYHLGFAGLINSLHKNGYKGEFFCGYKNHLPPWASNVFSNETFGFDNVSTFKACEDLSIHFILLAGTMHLSNFKPTFMLSLLDNIDGIQGIVYFDPDIVVKCKWKFYETWATYGISLVHEVTSNDMPENHPIRKGWEQVILDSGRLIQHKLKSYLNAGFCGVVKENKEFLVIWMDLIGIASDQYGLDMSKFSHLKDRTNLFYANDQDAMNIAAMCCTCPISEMGPEAMDFVNGGWTMSHAVGSPKPWDKNFILSAFNGRPPGKADRAFWASVEGPIKAFPAFNIKIKNLQILIGALIGRFYRRY